jgi:hypothetical protein
MRTLPHMLILLGVWLGASHQCVFAKVNAPHGGAVDWAYTNMHFWSIGSVFHVLQFDEWQDSQRQPCERTNAIRQPTYTVVTIDLARRSYVVRVRLALWQIGVCALFAGVLLFILLRIIRRSPGDRNGDGV